MDSLAGSRDSSQQIVWSEAEDARCKTYPERSQYVLYHTRLPYILLSRRILYPAPYMTCTLSTHITKTTNDTPRLSDRNTNLAIPTLLAKQPRLSSRKYESYHSDSCCQATSSCPQHLRPDYEATRRNILCPSAPYRFCAPVLASARYS